MGLAFATAPAWAQLEFKAPPPAKSAPQTRVVTALEAAELLIQGGRFAEAKRVLDVLEKANPADSQVQFLLAMIEVQEKQYPAAIHRFRRILIREPGVMRVRLELARAFFLEKDYDNAERQFRFARAGDPPPAVKQNIDAFLYQIRQARRFSYNLSVAAAPDTNLNAGPTQQTVAIFGLPFELSDQARRQSGVGATLDAGGEWSPAITDRIHLRAGGQMHRSEYAGGDFDDMTLSAYAGPRFIGPRWEISPLVTAYRRWYGNRDYNRGTGGALQATLYPTPKLGLNLGLNGQQSIFVDHDMDGPSVSVSAGAFYTLTSDTVLNGSLSMSHQDARVKVYANTAWQLAFGVYRDLPHGFSASVQPSYAKIDYSDPFVAFGATRRDRQWAVQTTLLNRRIDVWGFTPRVAYTYTSNASSISLYAYERQRVEMGFTRNF
jgi:hypothetical protein